MRATMIRRLGLALAVPVAGVALLSGCQLAQAYKDERRSQALQNTVKVYIKAVRWGEYSAAADHIRARDGGEPRIDLAALADVRVVKSEHTLAANEPGDVEAEMFATFQYYREDSAVVRTVSQKGTWWYALADERWYFDGELPTFGN